MVKTTFGDSTVLTTTKETFLPQTKNKTAMKMTKISTVKITFGLSTLITSRHEAARSSTFQSILETPLTQYTTKNKIARNLTISIETTKQAMLASHNSLTSPIGDAKTNDESTSIGGSKSISEYTIGDAVTNEKLSTIDGSKRTDYISTNVEAAETSEKSTSKDGRKSTSDYISAIIREAMTSAKTTTIDGSKSKSDNSFTTIGDAETSA